jgi:hypothetical protein
MLHASQAVAVSPAFVGQTDSTEGASIHPYHIHISDEALTDLRRRIAETRWPDQETVSDASQGVQLTNLQQLAQYWDSDYDWRKAEKLNALPEYVTTVDGVDIGRFQMNRK